MPHCHLPNLLIFISLMLLSTQTAAERFEVSRCASCHAKEVQQWQGSHHFYAMSHVSEKTVLGDFQNIKLQKDNLQFQLRMGDGEYLVEIKNDSGDVVRYPVRYTFGHYPLQQYAISVGKGKIQFIPFAWDSRSESEGGKRWFELYPDQKTHDLFHWTQMGQNWNQMCADCHTTDFQKHYDPKTRQYQSTYSAVNVSCEACHGSSQQHLDWANGDTEISQKGFPQWIGKRTPFFVSQPDGQMKAMTGLKESQQVAVCATCHARRTQLADRTAPHHFLQDYQGALLTSDIYHVDGQIWQEDYVWGSFLQSKMYQAGVTCTNCHNPHSGETVLPGNQTCTQCHSTTTYDNTTHHRHAAGRAGSQCVDCHMPATTYMQIDPRRDHSFRIPRPDLTLKTQAPNACNQCHADQSAQWASQHLNIWFPKSRHRSPDHFSLAFQAADQGSLSASESLTRIAQSRQYPEIVRASAIVRMAAYPDRNSQVAIARAVREDAPLKRQAAIGATALYPIAERYRLLAPLLADERAPIRAGAAQVLAPMLTMPYVLHLTEAQQSVLKQGLATYRDMQRYQSDRGFSYANLGNLAVALGEMDEAESHFQTAIDVEPIFIPAYVNLADVYRVKGDETKARAVLDQALKIHPNEPSVLYAKAMSWVRSGEKAKASPFLKGAVEYSEGNVDYLYTYGLLLQALGHTRQAVGYMHQAMKIAPQNPEIYYTVVQSYLQLKDFEHALFYAQQLALLVPGNAQIQQLIQQIQRMRSAQPRVEG
ncbi:tetratricopeptide repeat protein [Photobacterium galatheae]|uniref:tetratricopeptide repeat protein n=1 Tax=Photobacterium galatheae TaxID=1654360 RepID=UPI0032C21023